MLRSQDHRITGCYPVNLEQKNKGESMKTKWVSIIMTEEQRSKIDEAVLKDAIKNKKKANTSAFILDIVLNHINGGSPKETIQESTPKPEAPTDRVLKENEQPGASNSIADLDW